MTDTGTLRIRNVITLDYDKTFVFTIAGNILQKVSYEHINDNIVLIH